MKLYRHSNIGAYIHLESFEVLRTTPKGFWIRDRHHNRNRIPPHPHEHERWVSSFTKKRFAYPTKQEAWTSFQKRKQRQLAILKAQIRNLEAIERHTDKNPPEHGMQFDEHVLIESPEDLVNSEPRCPVGSRT